MGRPLLDIDEAMVAELASQGAKNREIADILGLDDKTVANRFSALLDKKRAERRIGIRNAQTAKALGGDTAMLIWLGKNELDQSDKQAQEVSVIEVRRVRKGIDGRPARVAPSPGEDPGAGEEV